MDKSASFGIAMGKRPCHPCWPFLPNRTRSWWATLQCAGAMGRTPPVIFSEAPWALGSETQKC